jgi:prolyl 4-hydroxylase
MSILTGLRILGILVPVVAILLGVAQFGILPSNWINEILGNNAKGLASKTYVLSNDPVVVYVEDFISTEEAAYLVALS